MNLEELEKPIQDIIKLVEKIDDKYRVKCFEILLNFYLKKELQMVTELGVEEKEKELEGQKEEFLIPIDVRAFLLQYNIPEEKLKKLFLIEKNQVIPIYQLTTTKKATAQIQIALLTALESATSAQGAKFEFSMENVRERCKNYKVYDEANFKAHFKNNQRFFKSLKDEEHVEVSPEGLTELADVISAVTTK